MSQYDFNSDNYEVPPPEHRLLIADRFLHFIFHPGFKKPQNFVLRGSLLTRHYLRKGGVESKNIWNFKDIDLLYYCDADLVTKAQDFPVAKYVVDKSSSDGYWDVVAWITDVIEKTSKKDFVVGFQKELNTFEEDPNPSVKLIFSVEMQCKSYLFTVDIASGDPMIGPPQMIACKTKSKELYHINAASLPMQTAWKVHSSTQDGSWRPKDFYDLYYLLQVVDSCELYPYLHLAFASKNDTVADFVKLISTRDSQRFPQSAWNEFLKEEGVPFLDLNQVFLMISEKIRLSGMFL